eukprot:TRINITY_DN7072_c0_g1_i1.p1 TRINITY_DN7072_c0_g1~~TRINITY_DN7072_c0_g1_i1.p1  ORF type:complete len:386 (+),score=56.03 TRINITY_DN7072_c0_g1_i1:255-1412(+)
MKLLSAEVVEDRMRVKFDDGFVSEFHFIWLRDNDWNTKESSSKQKLVSVRNLNFESSVAEFEISPKLIIRWEDGHESSFDIGWLRSHCYCENTLNSLPQEQAPTLWDASLTVEGIPRLSHDSLENEQGVWEWAQHLADEGICIISDVPRNQQMFSNAVNKLGRMKDSMYGRIFDVITVPDPINLAYTNLPIDPHVDLCYYESVPGFQFLHWLHAEASGGESIFLDGFKVIEDLRIQNPKAFHILSTYPMTFLKIDPMNHQEYRRPIIDVDSQGQILALHYSPPWEGPLRIPSDMVTEYYRAYKSFQELMFDPKYLIEFRMNEGDLVAWNNRRVLHGRRGVGDNGGRHVQGCYIDSDEFSNRWRYLKRKLDPESPKSMARIGNYSH